MSNNNNWGGKRPFAGRKRKLFRIGPPHKKRLKFNNITPFHVTVSLQRYLPPLRTIDVLDLLIDVFENYCEKNGFFIIAFSIQLNHMHFIIEALNNECLTKGMQGLLISIAKNLNKIWNRKGKVFLGRYFAREIKDVYMAYRMVIYVLMNHKKHGRDKYVGNIDPASSSPWFKYFLEKDEVELGLKIKVPKFKRPVTDPRSELLKKVINKHRLITVYSSPNTMYDNSLRLLSAKLD
jgi:REP element-mobilizing transposase RayT